MKTRVYDFEDALRQPEALAREVLADFLRSGIPADPDAEADRMMRAAGGGKWVLFENWYHRAPRPRSREALALKFLEEVAGARTQLRAGEVDSAARLAFHAALAFALLLMELSETREREGAKRGAAVKRNRSERDGAKLARRFERLEATHDEWTKRDICKEIAREMATGNLKLELPRSATAAAVARTIQRYRRPLR